MNDKSIPRSKSNRVISYSLIATQLFYFLSAPFSHASTLQNEADLSLKYSALISDLANTISSENDNDNDGNIDNVIENKMRDYANRETENFLRTQTSNWLSQYGTASFDLKIDNFKTLKSGEIDLLVPFFSDQQDSAASTWFIQPGAVFNDDSQYGGRKFIHMGLGYRTKGSDSFLGINAFYDYDLTRSHQRASVGAEYARQYFKLSSNYYFPLSGWKESPDKFNSIGRGALLEERAAQGVDFNFSGYLPKLPWLSFDTTYQQFFGENIELSGGGDPVKNPFVLSSSFGFQPIPLFAIRTGYTYEKGGDAQFELGLDLTYRFGVPLEKQLAYAQISALKNLEFQLLDLVDRDHNIRLEYREATTPVEINFTMSEIAMEEGKTYPLNSFLRITGDTAQVSRIDFSGTAKSFIQPDNSLRAPAFNYVLKKNNSYTLSAKVTLKNGTIKSANSPTTLLITENKEIKIQDKDVTQSSVADPSSSIGTLGDASTANAGINITAIVRNKLDRPISGKIVTFATQAANSSFKDIKVTSGNDGKVTTTLYADNAGAVQFTLTVDNFVYTATATFSASTALPSIDSTLTASAVSTNTDGTPQSTISLYLKDGKGNPLLGEKVFFRSYLGSNDITDSNTITLSATEEGAAGLYTTTLKGRSTFPIEVRASIKGDPDFTDSVTVTLGNGVLPPSETKSVFTAEPASIVADGRKTTTLRLQLNDKDGKPISAKKEVTFAARLNGTVVASGLTIGKPTQDSSTQGLYTATLKGTVVGALSIEASIADLAGFKKSTSVELTAPVSQTPDSDSSTFAPLKAEIEADGVDSTTVSLALKDKSGSALAGKTVSFALLLDGTPITSSAASGITVSAITDDKGVYSASVTGTKAGVLTLNASVDGDSTFAKSTFVTLKALPPVLSESSLVADKSIIDANNVDLSKLTLTLKNRIGGVVTQPFTVKGRLIGIGGVLSEFTDQKDGTYTAAIRAAIVGLFSATVSVSGDGVKFDILLVGDIEASSANVWPSETASTLTPVSETLDVGLPRKITLLLKDGQGNLLLNRSVVFTLSVNGAAVTDDEATLTAMVDNNDGTYTTTFTGKKANIYQITATMSENPKSWTSTMTVSPPIPTP